MLSTLKRLLLLFIIVCFSCAPTTYRFSTRPAFPVVKNGSQLLQGICANATDSSYGFIPSNPVHVGGGPSNERLFLSMLCGPEGQRVQFARIGSFNGDNVIVDGYEVSFNGLDCSYIIYMDMYTYTSPMVPIGFIEKDASRCDK